MFETILPIILKFEGGYVNNPNDAGGATNKGVTQKTYNTFRRKRQLTSQEVRYITDKEVYDIYESFFKQSRAGEFSATHPRTSLVHFDFSINAGTEQSGKTLQRAIGGLLIDGIIGNKTLTGLKLSDDLSLALDYLKERELFYKRISNPDEPGITIKQKIQREKNKVFLKGWLHRNNKLKVIINDWPPS